MKCKCGNKQGEPMANPKAVPDPKTGAVLYYVAGFSVDGRCWFCCFKIISPDDHVNVREKLAALA